MNVSLLIKVIRNNNQTLIIQLPNNIETILPELCILLLISKLFYFSGKPSSMEDTVKAEEIPCDKCDTTFTTNACLKIHIDEIHLDIKQYKCDQCKESFLRGDELTIHIDNLHRQIEDYKCEYCSMPFADSGAMKRHVRNIHLKPEKNITCNLCEAKFYELNHLDSHMRKLHAASKDTMDN